MKHLIVYSMLLVVAFSSCKKDGMSCDVKDPVHNLTWLKADIQQNTSEVYVVYPYTYKGTDGFYIETLFSHGGDGGTNSFRNCKGDVIYSGSSGFVFEGNYPADFLANGTNLQAIYTR